MSKSTALAWLSKAVAQAARSAKFCATGALPDVDPGIELIGVGPLDLPLKKSSLKKLIEKCHDAPYGKGTKTLVNKAVRNTLELDPSRFRLSERWNEAVALATRQVAAELGLPADELTPKLYKLLVYQRGGFFLPHRDSEKLDRMVASMVVVLPNLFDGGALRLSHGEAASSIAFEEAARGRVPSYAAFYADCEHEVRPVTSGVRVCLTYNLVLSGKGKAPRSAAKPQAGQGKLAATIGGWFAARPAEPLVFALEHHYTQRSLSRALLKGADRAIVDEVVAAIEQPDYVVSLTHVTRHLTQAAYDEGDDNGEIIEEELYGDEWTSLAGKKQPWTALGFDNSSIVASIPLSIWEPTEEEYEGFTGNAGNTVDRWYHRSALVIWPRSYHFEVLARTGIHGTVPLFGAMVRKLEKTSKNKLETARAECVSFARAIIAKWPVRWAQQDDYDGERASQENEFATRLSELNDADLVMAFLDMLGEKDAATRIDSLVVEAAERHGLPTLLPMLKRLWSPRERWNWDSELSLRNYSWLLALAAAERDNVESRPGLLELCHAAVERLCAPEREPMRHRDDEDDVRSATRVETALPLLLKALVTCGAAKELSRIIARVLEQPKRFRLERCLIPTVVAVLPWVRKQPGGAPAALEELLTTVREQLERRTEKQPAPPADWTRPVEVECKCTYCQELKKFLADAQAETGRIAASQHDRSHIIMMINKHRCDASHTLDQRGRPYSLVLKKTSGSYQRAVKRYEKDKKLLATLPKSP